MKRFPKGMGLPMILFACGLLAMATGVVGAYAISNLNALSREQSYDQAHYGSYSGIQWALSAVSQDPRTCSAAANQAVVLLTFASNPDLSCKVFIYSNLAAASTRCDLAPDGTIIPENLIYVVADSQIQGQGQSGSTRSAQLSALCTPKQYYFNHALLGINTVKVLGTSTVDGYTGGSTYATPASPVVDNEGSVATNDEQTPAAVSIASGSNVNGDAFVGKNGNYNTGIDLQGTLLPSGQKKNLSENIAVKLDHTPGKADVTFPTGLTVGGGQTKHLQGGYTYFVEGDLNLSANAQIVVDPNPDPQGLPQEQNAFVFIQGNVNVNQGTLGDKNAEAERLQLFLPKRAGGHTFTMNQGSGSFLICGPDLVADINNNSDIQGGVIAKDIKLDNSKMHFDTNLRNNPKGPMGWSVGGFNSDNHGPQTGGNFNNVAPPTNPGPGPGPAPTNPGPAPPMYTTPPYTSSSTQIP
ncbi:MAG: hypothetical protein KF760_19360 [Candidatus Eremiobacteraeota bacterium]|nr:hypothetical protein [Candidatus Eremiobacteraeota bacterium]MCW5868326.1 hypothetical protein [Candidatus Eremiobacteraeota bacterium]